MVGSRDWIRSVSKVNTLVTLHGRDMKLSLVISKTCFVPQI